ncbi:alpha/beta fold hydrolase [Amycolatopsis benzoatilytica]|uniref:alpha/beta fold hydrolase n=1 Tax=Amycolatopsis benzoatilytica TaxID=346045 RepID=UPI00037AC061|nr:alpha/beta hydrolase [Amycolatopsis benzoatilytica]
MIRQVEANGVRLNVAVAGSGPAVLLLHGFPHTWQLWREVLPTLAEQYRVIAPDLRGLGGSSRPADGFDAGTTAADFSALLDALGEPSAAVVAIDLSVAGALLLAAREPERVRRLVLMESLPGGFPAGGPPWWFGFHAVPGLAETILNGHEAEYVGWFLDQGTLGRGVPPEIQAAFTDAYTGPDALRCAFDYYRAMPESVRQVNAARLTVPTMAIGAHPIGAALEKQLRPIADDLVGQVLPGCGHLIPLDRPRELLDLLLPFLARDILSGCR